MLYYLFGHFHVIFKVKTPVIWNSPIHGKSRSNQPIQAGKDTNKTKPSKKKDSISPLNETRGTFSTPATLDSCHKKQSESIWDYKAMGKMVHRGDGRIPTKLCILLDTKRTLTQLNTSGLGTPRSDCPPEKTVRSIRAAFKRTLEKRNQP